MATSRSTGFTVTAAIWNAVLAGLTDAGVYVGQIVSTFFGSHSFIASGTGGQSILVQNTTAGTGNSAYVGTLTDASGGTGYLHAFSSTYTPSGGFLPSAVAVRSVNSGGLSVTAEHASGAIRFYSGGNTHRAEYTASGHYVLGSGTNITDGVGTPTIASGFGTSPSIVGKSYGFRVTHGTGTSTGGVVNFGTTYTNAPIVVVSGPIGEALPVVSVSTTQVTIATSGSNLGAGDEVNVLVRGF